MFTARKSLLVVSFLIATICTSSVCALDPGIADTVRIGDASGDVYSVLSVPVSLYNDEALTSINIPVFVNGYSGWMTFDSITYVGGRLDGGVILPEREAYTYYTDTFSVEAVIVRFSVSSGDPLPPGDGVICNLWFSPKFGGEVILDTMHVSPYTNLRLTDDTFIDFLPQFQPGTIEIACDYAIGEINGDGVIGLSDLIAFQKAIHGCGVAGYHLIPYIDDINMDRRVNARDVMPLVQYAYQGIAPECGTYNPANNYYDDPGIPDTLYIEVDTMYVGVPTKIALSYTNDEDIKTLALALKYEGNTYFDAPFPYESLTYRTTLEGALNAWLRNYCGIHDGDTTGYIMIYTYCIYTDCVALYSGSGPIYYFTFIPRNVGTSTIRITEFLNSGAESMFVTEANKAIVPVVVGGNITVLPRPCGDANRDAEINIGDAVYIINYVFKGGTAPDPLCIADANGDTNSNIGDAVYLVNYAFKGGPPPVTDCCPE